MRENANISYRGATYEIGRAPGIYAIWAVVNQDAPPLEWWPETAEGWYMAWSRFVSLEAPSTITALDENMAVSASSPVRVIVATTLLLIGIICGLIGLFPSYLNNTSLAQHPAEVVPHAIYLATWAASTLLICLGGKRVRLGALLGLGTSLVTFGFFFADAGTAISEGAHVMGAGLALALFGWLTCAVGSATALVLPKQTRLDATSPKGFRVGVSALAMLAIAVAATFAPSWDSYTLRTAAGTTESLAAGNIFSNPGPVIAGNLAVMIAFVAVVVASGLWRRIPFVAALFAGAVIPMLGQAISALVQLGEGVTPAMFGISSTAASQAGLTISAGLTWAFWAYCALCAALIVVALSRFVTPGAISVGTNEPNPAQFRMNAG